MTIRRVDAKTGIITRIAGTADNAHLQYTGAALATSIGATTVLALADGSLLVTDTVHDRIRKLVLQKLRRLSQSAPGMVRPAQPRPSSRLSRRLWTLQDYRSRMCP